MTKSLFFIPIIARALEQPDPKDALRYAFDRIQHLGRQREYREGYANFLRFMAEAVLHDEGVKRGQPLEEIIDHFMMRFDQESEEQPLIKLLLEHEGRIIHELDLSVAKASIGNITPGEYRLKLSTGWVIWHGEIKAEDVLYAKAYPDRPLELAADTGDKQLEPSREIRLLDDELILRMYPGPESGHIEIEKKSK